jgi:GNAT superfamily N-acetyltransferase
VTYGWRESDGAPLGGIELCDQCGFDARAVADEPAELDEVFVQLARLSDHPYRGRRPEPETFSADEYVDHCVEVARALLGMISDVIKVEQHYDIVDLPSARAAAAHVLSSLSGSQREVRHTGTYSRDVSAGWIARHLLHDLAHHVLDIRCGYAKFALAELPGDWNAGPGTNSVARMHGHDIRQTRLDDSGTLVSLFDALGYPADAATIQRRLWRLHSDASYESWVACSDGAVIGFAAGHLVHPIGEDDPVGQLIALVTAPQHEGSGVGQALVAHFEAWALSSQAQRLLVTSGDHRAETHAFYLQRGYTQTGLRFGKSLVAI